MALQPMDLQVLFMRLDTVGRESTAQQQAVAQGQQVAGEELAERSQALARQVRELEELPDGSQKVEEDEEKDTSDGESRRERKGDDSSGASDSVRVFRDPDLGRTIDVSG